MSDQTKSDKRSRAAMISDWGSSLLNKLPAVSRRRLKRKADKTRRQQEKAELKKEIE